jgi:predicted Rossmann fold flavoprotein
VEALRLVVIGGGAAGFFGAIAAAKSNPRARVILLEASNQPLAKVRISGGGRCNVTHACFDPKILIQNYPRGEKALLGAFTRFQPQDTVAWFAAQGVQLKTEADGRMFPTTDSSETIVNCLLKVAKTAQVELRTQAAVVAVKQLKEQKSASENANSGFEILLKSTEKILCDRLLLATGSNPTGYKIAQHLGHTIEQPVPSLFTFNVSDEKLTQLAGISVNNVKLNLLVAKHPLLEQTGSLLITHWGLSGPAVLKLSAWGARALHASNYQATLIINWLPQLSLEELRQKLIACRNDSTKRLIVSHRGVDLPQRLWKYIVSRAGISAENRWSQLSNKNLNQLVQELSQGKYFINGKGVFKEEFVTCGGVNLKQVNFQTMESKLVPGLYFAGEILDIDGVTGGFNFQSAWTTAYLAGTAMAK